MPSPSSDSLSNSFLPHLNGLRALAILGVLIYHLRASYCPAGYFGVDLFLVISGFLLFRSLLKPGAEQNFHYGSYLLKKAWRMLPSWFIVTVFACAVSLYLLPGSRVGDILKTARHAATFDADIYIDSSGDYFNAFTQQNPMLHFWYLSITQQLYIVAPLLVIPLMRWCSRRAAIVLLSILALLSITFYVLTTSMELVPATFRYELLHAIGAKTTYYHLIPRFWEILAGAGVFLLPEFANKPRLRNVLGLLGLIGIVASFYLCETGSAAVYLTVVSSLLALRYGMTGLAARLLNNKLVQALGTISFSLYLWHWPVMVFWKYCSLDNLSLWSEVSLVAVCLVLAVVSWRYVECIKTPSRTGWKGTLLRCSLLLLIPLVTVSTSKANKYVKKQLEAKEQQTCWTTDLPPLKAEKDKAMLQGLEFMPQYNMKEPTLHLGVTDKMPNFIFMGDSHAGILAPHLNAACQQLGLSGMYISNKVVPFWNLIHPQSNYDTAYWNEEVANHMLRYLEQHPGIRAIVISLWWDYRFKKMPGMDWRTNKSFDSEDDRMAVTGPGLGEFCDRVRALGVDVVLLGDNPFFDKPSPLDEWERYQEVKLLQYLRPYRERSMSVEEHEKKQEFVLSILRQLAEQKRAYLIDLAEALRIDGIYPTQVNGEFLYMDDNHLTPMGAQRAIDYMMPRLLEVLNRQQEPATGASIPQ